MLTTGAVNIGLKRTGKVVPYATLGAGVISNLGGTPSVSLVGHYEPRFNGVTPFDETDSVNVRFAVPDRVFVGVIGGGIKHYVSSRWGWRADVRAHLSPNRIDTIVEARPAVSTLTPAAALSIPVNPTVQFTNNPSTGTASSLSGPQVIDFRSFTGTGVQSQTSATMGVFWRFNRGEQADLNTTGAPASPASNATRTRNWEVEGHAGGMQPSNPAGGTASLPAAGASFTTLTGLPSRRASSWYFGDGAVLLNQINTGFGLTQRFTALDTVLAKLGAELPLGGDVGFRVSRRIRSRFSAEFSWDYALARLKVTDAMLAGIESSRASFATNLNTLLVSTGGPFTNVAVTSTSTLGEGTGRQIFTTGAVNINLTRQTRTIPYLTFGAGAVINTGDLPSVTVAGNYQFRVFGLAPINETDTVKLHYAADNTWVTVLGGGVKRDFSPRWGWRADARAYFSRNTVNLLLDSNPVIATGTPAGAISSSTIPSLQFSNNSSTEAQSNLTGPAIDGFKTFTGSGTQTHLSITVGFFTRF